MLPPELFSFAAEATAATAASFCGYVSEGWLALGWRLSVIPVISSLLSFVAAAAPGSLA